MRSSSLPRHQRLAIDLIQRLRPAPLSVILLKCMGLNRRRELPFGEHFFYADPSSQFGMSLLLGSFEPGTVAALEKYLAPGGTFLDLGANEGFFSVLASKLVGPVGQVISVEPQTRLLTILQKNLSLNFCYNCRVAHCVLSDENGKAVIHLSPSNNSGGTSLYRSTPYPLPVESVPVGHSKTSSRARVCRQSIWQRLTLRARNTACLCLPGRCCGAGSCATLCSNSTKAS